MKVLGLITEYNPFHLGHKYHLDVSKHIANADYSIAVMSGSFVQRGEPSIVDKWTKAKIAIDNGIDLVIELPFVFSTQSAELFAYGNIALLNKLNIVDCISFGSELGDLNSLKQIAKVLVDEPPYFREKLKDYLGMGYSFPVSRSKALEEYFNRYNIPQISAEIVNSILQKSNNILAIEYLKSLEILKSPIKPITIKRIGSSYNENELNHGIASATAIRNIMLNKDLSTIKKYLPKETFYHLNAYIDKYEYFNTLGNYSQIFQYLFIDKDKSFLKEIIDVEIGLENRIMEKSIQYNNINNLIQSISTKRYAKTRIQRILIHLMMGLTKPIFDELYKSYPSYIRVLGANKKGFALLNEIKRVSNISIITKFAAYKKHNNPNLDRMIYYDKKATDLFFLGLGLAKPYVNMDYYVTPYICTKT